MSHPTRRQWMQVGAGLAAGLDARSEDRESGLPFVVCFEVEPTAVGLDRYLELAKELRPALDHIAGFESIERSRSVHRERWLLSLSYWADEAALVAWRSQAGHHQAQSIGRNELFADYWLRVGQVVRRWSPGGATVAAQRTVYNLPPHHERSFLGILRIDGPDGQIASIQESVAGGPVAFETYESMVNRGRTFLVGGLVDEAAGRAVEVHLGQGLAKSEGPSAMRIIFETCEVERAYGRFERGQAPQYFPPIPQPPPGHQPG